MKKRPQNKLNYSGRVPSRADAHLFHSQVRLSSSWRRYGRRGRTPADACNHLVSDGITCKGEGRLTRPPRDVSLEYIRWRHVGRGFGPARAVPTVANVLAGAFPLGSAGSPAQQFAES